MAAPWTPRATSPLSYSPVKYSPDEILCAGSSDEDAPEVRVKKKLQREALGREYLQDRPPLILSASLRGPLHDGWINPWRKAKRQKVNKSHVLPRFTAARRDTKQSHGDSSAESSSEEESSSQGSEMSSAEEQRRYPYSDDRRHYARSPPSLSEEDLSEDDISDSNPNPGWVRSRKGRPGGERVRPVTIKEPAAVLAKLQRDRPGRVNLPTPTPKTQKQSKRKVTPVYSSSSSEDTTSNEQEDTIRSKSALTLASAIKEASKMKDKTLREQTLAFCKGTQAVVDQVNSLFPDITVPPSKASRAPRSPPITRKTLKAGKHNPQIQAPSGSSKPSNFQASSNRTTPMTVHIPIDFWAEPLRGLVGLAEMAQRLKDDMENLSKEAVRKNCNLAADQPLPDDAPGPTPKGTRKQSGAERGTEAESSTDQRPTKILDRVATGSPHVIPPSTTHPEFVYNRTTKTFKSAPEENASNTRSQTEKTPNVDDGSFPSTDPGPATEKVKSDRAHIKNAKAPRRLSFSTSGKLVLEIRVPPRRTQKSPLTVSPKGPSNETSNASVALPSGQVVSDQPGQRIKLPSEPSTNLLETDRQSLQFATTDEGNSDLAFSTQAAVARAQQAFQLDLESPANKIETSSPLSTRARKTSSAKSPQTNMTPLGHIRDSFAGPPQQRFSNRLEDLAISTQDLVNKMTPFAITTVKKPIDKRTSSPTSSPSKRRKPGATKSKDIDDDFDRACMNVGATPADPNIDYSPSLERFPSFCHNTIAPVINDENGDLGQIPRVLDRLAPQSTAFNQHMTEQRKYVENLKSNKGIVLVRSVSQLQGPQQNGLAEHGDNQFTQKNHNENNLPTKQSPMFATKTTPTPASKSRSPKLTPRNPNSQHPTPQRQRNARGQFSSPESLHTSTPRRPQSQPSASKPRSGLRSFRSSLSGTGQGQLQDGQYQHPGWSLDEVLDEAGSFLGTWDLEREVRKGLGSGSGSGSRNGSGRGLRSSQWLSQRSSGKGKRIG
ncbi:MAG: hypothetical protein Q9187_002490 [Circinaria calcarea]